jgi:hypothetical protein
MSSIGGRLRPWCILFYLFFCRSVCRPKQWDGVPPHGPPPHPLRYDITPIASADSRLIVGYLDQSAAYLMPRPASLSIIRWGLHWCPQTREQTAAPPNPMARALHRTIGSSGIKRRGCGGCCHGDRRPKPPEGRAAAAHVGCCVLWLCFRGRVSYFTNFVE